MCSFRSGPPAFAAASRADTAIPSHQHNAIRLLHSRGSRPQNAQARRQLNSNRLVVCHNTGARLTVHLLHVRSGRDSDKGALTVAAQWGRSRRHPAMLACLHACSSPPETVQHLNSSSALSLPAYDHPFVQYHHAPTPRTQKLFAASASVFGTVNAQMPALSPPLGVRRDGVSGAVESPQERHKHAPEPPR
ncbi:hypothetical protein EXIGLDRAFT_382434 [Exidia glandulosa HHB12029]|uniref:Uncharacterized protein n=1 Tax=Exidia glandulosa HHB12029 TaxID=1314781 RepID=A0A165ZCN0_EXIGL|nr:hypothetical protein EXIGLDRAFT_382434 [Exidia glandulosa HHB12029]